MIPENGQVMTRQARKKKSLLNIGLMSAVSSRRDNENRQVMTRQSHKEKSLLHIGLMPAVSARPDIKRKKEILKAYHKIDNIKTLNRPVVPKAFAEHKTRYRIYTGNDIKTITGDRKSDYVTERNKNIKKRNIHSTKKTHRFRTRLDRKLDNHIDGLDKKANVKLKDTDMFDQENGTAEVNNKSHHGSRNNHCLDIIRKRKRKPNPLFNDFVLRNGKKKATGMQTTDSKLEILNKNKTHYKERTGTKIPVNKRKIVEEQQINYVNGSKDEILTQKNSDNTHVNTKQKLVRKKRQDVQDESHDAVVCDGNSAVDKLNDITDGFQAISVPNGYNYKTLTSDDVKVIKGLQCNNPCDGSEINHDENNINATDTDNNHKLDTSRTKGDICRNGTGSENHDDEKKQTIVFECDVCEKLLMTKTSLPAHRLSCIGQKNYSCEVCGKSYVNNSRLQRHFQTHTSVKLKDPSTDGRRKIDEEMFERINPGNNTWPITFKCLLCFEVIETEKLTCHRKLHKRPCHVCDQCGRSFASSAYLNIHMRSHDTDKLLQCRQCSKTFLQQVYLEAHEKLHSGERPFICEICGSTFSSKWSATFHFKTAHTDNKRFNCDLCGQKFSRKIILQNHMATHMTKTFKCSYCAVMFKSQYDQLKHEKQHTGIKNFHCPICKHGFLTNGPYFKHMWRKHRMDRPEAKAIKDNINRDKKLARLNERYPKVTEGETDESIDGGKDGTCVQDLQQVEMMDTQDCREEIVVSQDSVIIQIEIGNEIELPQANAELVQANAHELTDELEHELADELAQANADELAQANAELRYENAVKLVNENVQQDREFVHQNVVWVEIVQENGQEVEIMQGKEQEVEIMQGKEQVVEIAQENGQEGFLENTHMVDIMQKYVQGIGNSQGIGQPMDIIHVNTDQKGNAKEVIIQVSNETGEIECLQLGALYYQTVQSSR